METSKSPTSPGASTAFDASASNAGLANGSWWNELQQAVIVLNRPVTPCVISQRFAEETVLLGLSRSGPTLFKDWPVVVIGVKVRHHGALLVRMANQLGGESPELWRCS